MSVLVVDAGSIAAVLFDKPEADDVSRRLHGHTLIAPAMMRFELDALCLTQVRIDRKNMTDYLMARQLLDDLQLDLIEPDAGEVIRYAARHDLDIHQAHYLFLCTCFEAELVSLDESLDSARRRISGSKTLQFGKNQGAML